MIVSHYPELALDIDFPSDYETFSENYWNIKEILREKEGMPTVSLASQ